MHQFRMFLVAIRTVALAAALAWLVISLGYFWLTTTENQRYLLEQNLLASLRQTIMMTANKMELVVDGRLQLFAVEDVVLLTEDGAQECWRILRNGAVIGGAGALMMVFLMSLYWWAYGRTKMQDDLLRGGRLVEGEVLARLVRQREEASP